jgi:formylglycine-generating enzyme required for sulfatase activity
MAKSRSRLAGLQILLAAILSACGTQSVSANPVSWSAPPASSPKESMPMVFVSAGTFEMGNDHFRDERPAHLIIMNSFWIDQTEVTNGQYQQCATEDVCQPPQRFDSYSRPQYYDNSEFANFPVIYVTWDDADTFCRWAGRRLPTEAEWERAARGPDARIYPWGNQLPSPGLLNYDFRIGDTSAVGSYPLGASPYGVLDMAGNVNEWVADWYEADYYSQSPRSDPQGPVRTGYRVVRGGSWLDNRNYVRSGLRLSYPPESAFVDLGFRCAESVPQPALFLAGPGIVLRR